MRINMFFLLTIILLANCKSEDHTASTDVRPVIRLIDSLEAEHLYNEAKWLMYVRYCSDTVNFTSKVAPMNKSYSFGELPIRIDTVIVQNNRFKQKDTIKFENDILFGLNFYYDTIPLYWETAYNTLPYGVYFNLDDTSVRGFYTDGYSILNPYFNSDMYPPFDNAKKYLIETGNKAHPWFREEAVRRGVLRED